ncbi:hypothetical protein BJY04DRAFT_219647 [Aspergillus karnatakaensis]|uniref:uncharacterized protein n=1 Tax=Aspergillus karnatakaensis TaxID=1810916 RepID=UPI003CCDBC35
MRDLLDDARRIEIGRAETFFHHPRNQKPEKASGGSNPQKPKNPGGTKAPTTPGTLVTLNRFPPTATKPPGWVGAWFDPETAPKRLTDEDKASLVKQGRCWACRGSAHRASDSCCPKHAQRGRSLNEITMESTKADLSDAEN